jgi:hypothetical protein
MGIHLPFVGYVRARGALSVRQDRSNAYNKKHIDLIREFFAALKKVPISVFKDFLPNPEWISQSGHFAEILFESDHDRRPELTKFMKMARPKSLVISTRDDLFEVENEIVNQFAKDAASNYIPILCLDDFDHQLSAAIVRNAGGRLPFLLMENQISFRNLIENRFAQLKD